MVVGMSARRLRQGSGGSQGGPATTRPQVHSDKLQGGGLGGWRARGALEGQGRAVVAVKAVLPTLAH